MSGYAKLTNFLALSELKAPSPTTDVVPPLPVVRGFSDLFWYVVICKRARVFRLHDSLQLETKKP